MENKKDLKNNLISKSIELSEDIIDTSKYNNLNYEL